MLRAVKVATHCSFVTEILFGSSSTRTFSLSLFLFFASVGLTLSVTPPLRLRLDSSLKYKHKQKSSLNLSKESIASNAQRGYLCKSTRSILFAKLTE